MNHTPITEQDLISLGYLKRTHNHDLPPFVFVRRDGLFVPFRSNEIASLMGEEIFVLRTDVQEEEDGLMTWQDLIGYTIIDEEPSGQTQRIGIIADIDESTINTLATLEDGRMLPLHEDFIHDIDETAHELHVSLPFQL
jgi:ribosomal 30S subunit maturation factor RimM